MNPPMPPTSVAGPRIATLPDDTAFHVKLAAKIVSRMSRKDFVAVPCRDIAGSPAAARAPVNVLPLRAGLDVRMTGQARVSELRGTAHVRRCTLGAVLYLNQRW